MVFKTFRPFFPTIEKTASFYAPYWPEMKAGYSYNYTLTANDYMTASPTVLEISGTDINPWTEVNKEETPDAKALGTEAKAEGSEWGEMETEEIIPVEKQ